MVVRKRNKNADLTTKDGSGKVCLKSSLEKDKQKKKLDDLVKNRKVDNHLVPMFLLAAVMVCSGVLWTLAFRDVFATGRIVAGKMDEAMLHFTRSTAWFDDSKGWKSTQGGFSAVKGKTTDENNMGGLFIRKLGGAAALAFHSQKLIPLIFQPATAHFGLGHYNMLLFTSVVGNLAIIVFHLSYMDELKAGGADSLPLFTIIALIIESIIMVCYALTNILDKSSPILPRKLPPNKTASSIVSKIVLRTVVIVSGPITIICGRDLFFPGQEFGFPPRDDIYLEWTGAFIHSPPSGTEEAETYGLEAALQIGDKFAHQLMALYMLILCFQKFACNFLIRVGIDCSGESKCKIFWKSQIITDALIMFVIRIFTESALSASLDLRWHLMSFGYQTFILGLFAFS